MALAWCSLTPDHPQVCIDWCDAVAYCEGVGKRLCGHTDPAVREYDANSLQSQWYFACSAAGQDVYPYGSAYDETLCDTGDLTAPVGTPETCQSSAPGFEGVFGMSDNVWEWEDNCDESDMCMRRGGSWVSNQSNRVACAFTDDGQVVARSYTENHTGFRCCSD